MVGLDMLAHVRMGSLPIGSDSRVHVTLRTQPAELPEPSLTEKIA